MSILEKEWFIEAPWGKIAIIAWGDCYDPPVLLCHGETDSAASFRPLVNMLPRKFYYIGMEFPGNGKSDSFPPGLMINSFDMVQSIKVVVDHFRWRQFVLISHSLGAFFGKLYNLVYPGNIVRSVELDPTASYHFFEPEDFPSWYKKYFTDYFERYDVYNSPRDQAPKYTRSQALAMLKSKRGLTNKEAMMTLDRIAESLDNGLVRFTYDQRTKLVTRPPFSLQQLKDLYTSIKTPTLAFYTESAIKAGVYEKCPFAMDESIYLMKNYKILRVFGLHDVHFVEPEKVSGVISSFLLNGLAGLESKAKL